MNLNAKQLATHDRIILVAEAIGLDSTWARAIAMTESSLGLNQKSNTGCVGVFQMSSIAMKDLLQAMSANDDDIADMAGLLFLHLLKKRWKTIEAATLHYCDPKDKEFYLKRVQSYMEQFKEADDELV
jgi:hypothetical protein